MLQSTHQPPSESHNHSQFALKLIQPYLVEKTSSQIILRLDKFQLDSITANLQSLTHHHPISQHTLQNVIGIVLYNNQLTSLDTLSCFLFPDLRSLQLHVNRLKSVDLNSFGSNKITFVDLSVNQLTKLEGITQENCWELKYLNLKKNKIEDVSQFEGLGLPSLKEFNLAYNTIRNLKALSGLQFQQLMVLQLGHNAITSLEPLYKCSLNQLTRLCLNNNFISWIRGISKCSLPRLKHLDLSNNYFSELDKLEQLSIREGKIINLVLSFNLMAEVRPLVKFIRKRTLKDEYFRFRAQCAQVIQNECFTQMFEDCE